MSLDIRTYRNTDGPELCAVFSAHYQAAGLPCTMTPLSLELCILAKAFFSPAQMLVAEKDGQVVGFLLLGFEPEDPLLTASSTRAVVSSLCVRPCEQEDRIASELLASSVSRCGQMGCEHLSFSPPPPASPFMAGLAPGDGMIGGPEIDFRLTRWLRASGWESGERVALWEIDLARFQPPMDRMQIQIRRMAHVDRLLDEPQMPWYIATMLGHAEYIGFQLTDRETRSVAADIVLWTIGHELIPQADQVARLWPLPAHSRQEDDLFVFLMAEAFRQLRSDRVDAVRTVAKESDEALPRVLERVGFQPQFYGTVYSARP